MLFVVAWGMRRVVVCAFAACLLLLYRMPKQAPRLLRSVVAVSGEKQRREENTTEHNTTQQKQKQKHNRKSKQSKGSPSWVGFVSCRFVSFRFVSFHMILFSANPIRWCEMHRKDEFSAQDPQ